MTTTQQLGGDIKFQCGRGGGPPKAGDKMIKFDNFGLIANVGFLQEDGTTAWLGMEQDNSNLHQHLIKERPDRFDTNGMKR